MQSRCFPLFSCRKAMRKQSSFLLKSLSIPILGYSNRLSCISRSSSDEASRTLTCAWKAHWPFGHFLNTFSMSLHFQSLLDLNLRILRLKYLRWFSTQYRKQAFTSVKLTQQVCLFFCTPVEASRNSWQSLDAILKQCKYSPILMQTYSDNLEGCCRCPSKGGFTVNETSTLSAEHWEDKNGRSSFNLRAHNASFLPSITLRRFMSLAHADSAKAQWKAASMRWGLGIWKRDLALLVLSVSVVVCCS